MPETKRQLAAIMFTDMVGYTALMQEDEQTATANRDRHRKILQESISRFNGNILQYYGDGTLIIFNSAIEAISSAIEIQMELQKEPKIPLRIGLHTGDIVYDEEGIYGDGVNVASRIEGLAISGSVLISGKVYDEVKNHRAFSTVSLGQFKLKNVKKPMEIYALSNEGLLTPTEKDIKTKPQEELKSLAVLPFINMSTDPDNEYFSDGITEELLNVLAKVNGLQVTARTSSFAFKGMNVDVKEIGVQLNAKSIVEGSVRKVGNKVRITAQLINASDGYHVWSETYDRELDDIFEVQDEISLKIATTLREKLTLDPAKESLVKPPTNNIEAYNTYLKGLFHANKWTAMDAEIAIREFERAVAMEPEFVLPYSRLSTLYVYLGATGKKPKKEAIPKAKEYALKALEIDNQAAESHEALANLYFFHEWDWNNVNQSLEKALKLNPNLPGAYLTRAMNFAIHAKFDEAFEAMQMSIQLDPFSAHGHYAYAAMLCFAGKLKESSSELDKLFDISPQFPDALSLKGLIHQLQGNFEEAKKSFTEVKSVPGFEMNANASLGALNEIMGNHKIALDYLEILLSAEEIETGHDISFNIAYIYAYLDKPDEMFQYLNNSIDKKDISVLYIQVLPSFKRYNQDPRFDKLVKKIGLK
jgi:adenylate cyclase